MTEKAKEWSAVPVSASALIPVNSTNFVGMRSVNDLNSVQNSAPAFHRRLTEALKAAGKVREDQAILSEPRIVQTVKSIGFGLGARVKTKEGRTGVIIQAKAGHTKTSHTPVHKVADSRGNSWLEKETNLKLIL